MLWSLRDPHTVMSTIREIILPPERSTWSHVELLQWFKNIIFVDVVPKAKINHLHCKVIRHVILTIWTSRNCPKLAKGKLFDNILIINMWSNIISIILTLLWLNNQRRLQLIIFQRRGLNKVISFTLLRWISLQQGVCLDFASLAHMDMVKLEPILDTAFEIKLGGKIFFHPGSKPC